MCCDSCHLLVGSTYPALALHASIMIQKARVINAFLTRYLYLKMSLAPGLATEIEDAQNHAVSAQPCVGLRFNFWTEGRLAPSKWAFEIAALRSNR